MSYQQPPGGGYPPGYPQQPPQQPQSQGYPVAPTYGGGGGSSTQLFQLIGLGLVGLGLLLRGIAGLLETGGSAQFKMGQVAAMFIAFGLLVLFYVLVNWGREKELPTAVRVVVASLAILIVLPLAVYFLR
jgi:hypothetical protein